MRHPFFNVINWDALYRREIVPPFDPCKNQDIVDAQNFESDFTNLPLVSVDGDDSRGERIQSDVFQNFTYEEESPLAAETKASAKDVSAPSKEESSWGFSFLGVGRK